MMEKIKEYFEDYWAKVSISWFYLFGGSKKEQEYKRAMDEHGDTREEVEETFSRYVVSHLMPLIIIGIFGGGILGINIIKMLLHYWYFTVIIIAIGYYFWKKHKQKIFTIYAQNGIWLHNILSYRQSDFEELKVGASVEDILLLANQGLYAPNRKLQIFTYRVGLNRANISKEDMETIRKAIESDFAVQFNINDGMLHIYLYEKMGYLFIELTNITRRDEFVYVQNKYKSENVVELEDNDF